LKLENEEDVADFFEDVCTINELNSIAQRLEVARLLKANTTFSEIEKQTGASSATISRVNRALQYGAGGYDLVL
jgi:TrpR-related protein YerC/YecD